MYTLWPFRRKSAPPRVPHALTPDERRFARGTRSLVDLIAPDAVQINPNWVRVGNSYARALVVTGLPREVDPGWLKDMIGWDEPVTISVHIHPLPSSQMVALLHHKLVQFDSSRRLAARNGQLADPERETAYADTERLRDALQRGTEHLFSVSLYLLVWGRTLAELDARVGRLATVLAGMLAAWREPVFEHDAALRSCLPEGLDLLQRPLTLDTTSLALMVPFPAPTLRMAGGVLYGIARYDGAPVMINPFGAELENANMVVFAKSGAGKSFFTKLIALRTLYQGSDCIIIDPEDEYRPLAEALAGQSQRIVLDAASGHRLNPFDLPPVPGGDGESPGPLAEAQAALLTLLDVMLAETPGAGLRSSERGLLDAAIGATYRQAGIGDDPRSHTRPAPLLRDLLAQLQAMPGEAALSLAARLEPFAVGALSAPFAGPTNVTLDRPFVIFSIRALQPELQGVAIHLITAFLWKTIRRVLKPRLLVIDEAWTLMQYAAGAAFVEALARRARKYYLGLITLTQDVADFLGSPHGRAVLTNASLKFLLKQDPGTVETLVTHLRLSNEERQYLLAAAKGEGLFFTLGSRVAMQVIASSTEHALVTTAPAELAARAAQASQPPGKAVQPPSHPVRRRLIEAPAQDGG